MIIILLIIIIITIIITITIIIIIIIIIIMIRISFCANVSDCSALGCVLVGLILPGLKGSWRNVGT